MDRGAYPALHVEQANKVEEPEPEETLVYEHVWQLEGQAVDIKNSKHFTTPLLRTAYDY